MPTAAALAPPGLELCCQRRHTFAWLGPLIGSSLLLCCCRYCANFTLTQLQPLFTNKLINHVHLDIIPYGNARTDPNTGTHC
jgi:hypothetical protein